MSKHLPDCHCKCDEMMEAPVQQQQQQKIEVPTISKVMDEKIKDNPALTKRNDDDHVEPAIINCACMAYGKSDVSVSFHQTSKILMLSLVSLCNNLSFYCIYAW